MQKSLLHLPTSIPPFSKKYSRYFLMLVLMLVAQLKVSKAFAADLNSPAVYPGNDRMA